MMSSIGIGSAVLQCLHQGPLGDYLDRYVERLAQRGYTEAVAKDKLRLVANLSRWLQQRNIHLDELDEQSIAQFLRDLADHGRAPRSHAATLQGLLKDLRADGIVAPPLSGIEESATLRVELAYTQYLAQERGLAPATLINYLPTVRCFLKERFGEDVIALNELRPQDAAQFILRHAPKLSPGRAKLIATILRSFLRFLYQHGQIATDLAAAVPSVANWRWTSLPKFLAPERIEQLLESCDRSSSVGQRNYAILLLMARLGLRAGEVVAMTLDDIDWDTGELTIRGKGARRDRLPIPADVGRALAQYLRIGRPQCTTRRVFVCSRAPRQGFSGSMAICSIVSRALARAGLDPTFTGAHLLRHSLATRMLRSGASLAEIGEILRHRNPNTTQIYAKVDLNALRALAQPWPGGKL